MLSLPDIEEALHRLYIVEPHARLRDAPPKKATELRGLLLEIERVVRTTSRGGPLRMVDAAAGKAYVGLLTAEWVLARMSRHGHVTLIERDSRRATACRQAIAALRAPGVECEVCHCDVADATAWPRKT